MKVATIIQHLSFEDLGSLALPLVERGFQCNYLQAGVDDLNRIKQKEQDLLIVLGGPIGADEEAKYPFLIDELPILKHRLENDLPLLGICLGAQLMARALGVQIYPAIKKEIGWKPLTITDAGHSSPTMYFSNENTSMFHWHGDTFDLPVGATRLASTDICANQVYSYGKNAIGFQCHPEIQSASIEKWLIGHAHEITSEGISVHDVREMTTRLGANLEKCSGAFFNSWLDNVGL